MSTSKEQLFVYLPHHANGEVDAVQKAIECIEAFTACFNDRDPVGMDALLHFPHAILSGGNLLVWDGPGQHSATFFDELEATGWHCTTYRRKQAVLAAPTKVHLLVEYSRDDVAGNVLSAHHNLWIVTFDGARWGITLRSY